MENLAKALVKAQGKLHNLSKNAKGYGYEYLTLDKLIDETRSVLAENGLVIIQPMVMMGEGQPAVKTVLLHESGELIEGVYSISAVTMKQCNDAQQMGAAITYARRYCLASILNIAQADDDTGSIKPSKAKKAKPAPKPPVDVETKKIALISALQEISQQDVNVTVDEALLKEISVAQTLDKLTEIYKRVTGEGK